MAATVNGVTLAALFYHHQSSPNDQEGFLFGKVLKNEEDIISDTQINNTQLQTTLYITDFLPWNKDISLYGTNGYLDKTMLESVLQGREKDVIGWYSCRRNTSLRVSMKEATLHRNLLSTIEPEYPEDFLFLLSTSSISTNLSTHSFDHALYRYRYSRFSKIRVNILNLGDTTHTQYKKQSSLSVSHKPDTLQTSYLQFRNKFENKSGEMLEVKNIQDLSHCLHEQLVSIKSLVKESEHNLSSLEQEVQQLALELKHEEDVKTKKPEPVPKDSWQPSLLDTSIEMKDSDIDPPLDIGTVNSDMLSNAYSIKLEELDNQVLDLERPSTSATNIEKTPSGSNYDETWLDISIDPSATTGVTTQTTVLQPTNTTVLQPKPLTSKQPTQTSVTTQAHNTGPKQTARPESTLKEPLHSATTKPSSDVTMKTSRSRTTRTKPNEVKSSDPFSFVQTMLSKDGKPIPIQSTSNPVPTGRGVRMPKAGLNQKELTHQSEKSTTSSQNRKETGRTSSSERQTRQNKTQKTPSDPKYDVSMETKIERAKTQRAKARSAQPHSRRSLSREDKKEVLTKEEKKDMISKDSKSAKMCDSDVREVNNVEKKCNSTDSKSSIPDKKDDYILTDDDTLLSSSPVF